MPIIMFNFKDSEKEQDVCVIVYTQYNPNNQIFAQNINYYRNEDYSLD